MIVTNKAPDFTATAVLADGQIVDDFNLKVYPYDYSSSACLAR